MAPSANEFITLASHCSLKRLEEPCLYDIRNDELYELGEDAYGFLLDCCRGKKPIVKKQDKENIILTFLFSAGPRPLQLDELLPHDPA